jgi:deoxyribodipyrimidine photo-lyase
MTRTGVVLFTRDLRVQDNAALARATRECDTVVPLFVLDDRLLTSANRVAFLLESLADLRASLGGALVVRRGDVTAEIARFEPDVVYLSEDVSAYAHERELRLRRRFAVRALPGLTVTRPGTPAPAGADHYRVFTPYWRAWRAAELPAAAETRLPVRLPDGVEPGPIPELDELVRGRSTPARARGGERAGLERLERFDLRRYEDRRDDLPDGTTSRLSAYLHLGCVSPAEVARRAEAAGAEGLLRQLCWRDFYAQLLAARPRLASEDFRPVRGPWLDDAEGVAAWREGRTGYPVVDAAMRQLRDEGWMPNRARLIVASFLTRHLLVDWRVGAAHFLEQLVDGDLASNAGNWQWVAGTGTDTRPGRYFNPVLQGRRYDPSGDYVRRFVPELASLPADHVHDPAPADRRAAGYPDPIVDHRAAVQRLRVLR